MTDFIKTLEETKNTKKEKQCFENAILQTVYLQGAKEESKSANTTIQSMLKVKYEKLIPTNRNWTDYILINPKTELLDSLHVDFFNHAKDRFLENMSPDYYDIKAFCQDTEEAGKTKKTFAWLSRKESREQKKLVFVPTELSKQKWQQRLGTTFNEMGKETITGKRSAKKIATNHDTTNKLIRALWRHINADEFEGNQTAMVQIMNRMAEQGFKIPQE